MGRTQLPPPTPRTGHTHIQAHSVTPTHTHKRTRAPRVGRGGGVGVLHCAAGKHLGAHGSQGGDDVQMVPQALALGAHHAPGAQRAVHGVEEGLQGGGGRCVCGCLGGCWRRFAVLLGAGGASAVASVAHPPWYPPPPSHHHQSLGVYRSVPVSFTNVVWLVSKCLRLLSRIRDRLVIWSSGRARCGAACRGWAGNRKRALTSPEGLALSHHLLVAVGKVNQMSAQALLAAFTDVGKFPAGCAERERILDTLVAIRGELDPVKEQSLFNNLSTTLTSNGRTL